MVDPCPSAELLAAYGDGKLSPAERRQVEKHLAVCEDCFELFAAAAEFRLEEAGSAPGAEPAQARRPAFRWWPQAAAAAVMVAGAWLLLDHRAERPNAGAEVLALADGLGGKNELRAAAGHAWSDGDRGLALVGGLPADKRAFRLGVHLLDARVALGAGDSEGWTTALEQAAALLPPSPSEAAGIVDRLRAFDGALDDSSARRKRLDELAVLARAPASGSFDFGAWTEAGRLAALDGRTDFLEKAVAGRLNAVARADQDPAVATEVDKIRGALGDHHVSADELSALERSFEQLIYVH